jgi:hypothetical protein
MACLNITQKITTTQKRFNTKNGDKITNEIENQFCRILKHNL